MRVFVVAVAAAALFTSGCVRPAHDWGEAAIEPYYYPLDGLGDSIVIDDSADSWPELCAKVKPTFAWNGMDMMWIESDAQGKPLFRLNHAYVYQPDGEKPQWVCLSFKEEGTDGYYFFMGHNVPGKARLMGTKPTSDHGSGDYAIVLSENPQHGTVYEVGWQKEMANGTSLAEVQRRLYLLKDRKGRWVFLGEGPEVYWGRSGWREMEGTYGEANIVWESRNGLPCRVEFFITNVKRERAHEGVQLNLPTLETREEGELDGSSKVMRVRTPRPYVLVQDGEPLSDIVERLSVWTLGWDDENKDSKVNATIRDMWRKSILRLNPGIEKSRIDSHMKVWLPTYVESLEYRKHVHVVP